MSIPGGWIGGFSLLHSRSAGPENMHQYVACYHGLKYQLLAWKQQLFSIHANSVALDNWALALKTNCTNNVYGLVGRLQQSTSLSVCFYIVIVPELALKAVTGLCGHKFKRPLRGLHWQI